jgi:hypothetical protein
MRMAPKQGIAVLVVMALVMVIRCGTATVAGGGASTGNARVAGMIVDTCGHGVPGSAVYLYKAQDIPFISDSGRIVPVGCDTTGPDGSFCLTVGDTGAYTLESSDSSGGRKAIACNIRVGSPGGADSVYVTVRLGPITSFMGLVADAPPVATVCFIPGTPHIAFVNNASGQFMLDSIPFGKFEVVFKVLDASSFPACSYSYSFGQPSDTAYIVRVVMKCR